jgi:hypothetical protein
LPQIVLADFKVSQGVLLQNIKGNTALHLAAQRIDRDGNAYVERVISLSTTIEEDPEAARQGFDSFISNLCLSHMPMRVVGQRKVIAVSWIHRILSKAF